MGFWWRPLVTLSVIALIALVLWAGGGAALALKFAVIALLAYLARQLWQEKRLAQWLEHGGDRPAPSDISSDDRTMSPTSSTAQHAAMSPTIFTGFMPDVPSARPGVHP